MKEQWKQPENEINCVLQGRMLVKTFIYFCITTCVHIQEVHMQIT